MLLNGWIPSAAASLLVLLALAACGGTTDRSGKSGSGGSGGAGQGRCEYGGKVYEVDEVFPSNVDCNRCRCNEDLVVSCGLIPCHVCSEIETHVADSLERARLCDPSEPNPCTQRVMSGPPCWCETLVNPQTYQPGTNDSFIYADLGCQMGITCGMCSPPLSATCSAEGRCVDNY